MMRTSTRAPWLTRLLLLLVLALPTATAVADEPGAQERFTAALAEFDAGNYQAALEGFRQAYRESESPNARLYVARSLRKLERLAEAYDELYATMRAATDRAAAEPKYEQTRDAAAAELAILEPQIAKLVVAVTDAADVAAVAIDGRSVAPDRVGTPITVEPGAKQVAVELADGRRLAGTIELEAGQARTLTLSPREDPPEPDVGPPPSSAETAEPTGGGVRIAGFVVAGLGVAGMVLFGVTGSLAADEFGALEEECGELRCADPAYADVVDRGKTYETVANVSLVAGLVGLVGGTAMILFGGPSDPGEETAARLELRPAGAGLALRGAF